MSDMKCPFCGKEIIKLNEVMYGCVCDDTLDKYGTKELWQELITTRKAPDKAIWWLNEIVENHRFTPISTAEMALKEITALEQKE